MRGFRVFRVHLFPPPVSTCHLQTGVENEPELASLGSESMAALQQGGCHEDG